AAVWSGRGRGRRGDSGLGRVGRISRYHTATFFTNFRVTRGGAEPLGDRARGETRVGPGNSEPRLQAGDQKSAASQKPRSRGILHSLFCCVCRDDGEALPAHSGAPLLVEENGAVPKQTPVQYLLPEAKAQDLDKICVVYVLKRPHVDEFLQRMGELFECVLFTASLAKSCVFHRGNYVKDLSRLGRDLRRVLILDNSPASYVFHPDNAVPVASWFDNMSDTELHDLLPFFEQLSRVDDVYSVLRQPRPGS
ncbi:hypothetical protein E2I00_003123, partial [Balaenoptera physalus]